MIRNSVAILYTAVSSVILAQLLSASPAISEEAFCTAMRKVAAEAVNDFFPLMGPEVGAATWSAKVTLPGSTYCKIGGEYPGTSLAMWIGYSCSFAAKSAPEARKTSQVLQDSLRKCFPGVDRSEILDDPGIPEHVQFGLLPGSDATVTVFEFTQPDHSVEVWVGYY